MMCRGTPGQQPEIYLAVTLSAGLTDVAWMARGVSPVRFAIAIGEAQYSVGSGEVSESVAQDFVQQLALLKLRCRQSIKPVIH
jgi:hypothetical protein